VLTSVEVVLTLQRRRGITVGKGWTWVAWSMLAIYVVGVGVGMPLMVANGEFQRDPGGQASLILALTAFMVVGAVIVAHRPGNAIGWIFSAIGLLTGTGFFAWQYAEYAYITRGSRLPGALLSAWYNNWWWFPTLILATIVTVLVFPTGRLLSARWRPVAWLTAAITATTVALSAFAPTLDLGQRTKLRNPIGLAWIPDTEHSPLGPVVLGLVFVCTGAAAVSLVLRFRRSQGVERQQLKWFTYAGVLLFSWSIVDFALPEVAPFTVFFGLTIALVPVAAGIAVLRYRLYDIDRLINRTLVYGLLTLYWPVSTLAQSWSLARCSAGSAGGRRAGRWPAPPWLSRPCSSRPATASNRWLTGASTGATTMRPRPSRPTTFASATSSTWIPSRPSCWRWLTTPWSQPGSRCGFDPPRTTPRAHPTVRHDPLPGPTER